MSSTSIRLRRALGATAATAAVLLAATGCGGGGSAGTAASVGTGRTEVSVAAHTGAPFSETKLAVEQVDSIRNTLPKAIRDSGELRIGVGALPAGFPPLAFVGTDQKSLTGAEPDLGRLVAGVLGLKPVLSNATWENLFVGFDSGRTDVGFADTADTEKRKEKYDFATYRKDDIAFEAKKGGSWKVASGKDIAGRTIAVGSGTNQEKILVDWNDANIKAGLPAATIKYFQNQSDTYLALTSGRIDAYLGPNPSIAYHVATSGQTETIGKFSGAGPTLQGLIAATTKKNSGLVQAYQAAINAVIADGSYAKVLQRWNVSNEAVAKSEINPPGLPLTT
jgi:polar amino acid transport system substrate-binding protein